MTGILAIISAAKKKVILQIKLLYKTNFQNLKQNPNSRDKRETFPSFGFMYGLIHPREVKQGIAQIS